MDLRSCLSVLLALLLSCSGSHVVDSSDPYSKDHSEVSVDQLVTEHSEDPAGFWNKYRGRQLTVIGRMGFEVVRVSPDSPESWLRLVRSTSEPRGLRFRLTGSLAVIHGIDGVLPAAVEESEHLPFEWLCRTIKVRGILAGGVEPFLQLNDCSFAGFGPLLPRNQDDPYELVGDYFRFDHQIAGRIANVLCLNAIEYMEYGSLGFSISVPSSQAQRARSLLR